MTAMAEASGIAEVAETMPEMSAEQLRQQQL